MSILQIKRNKLAILWLAVLIVFVIPTLYSRSSELVANDQTQYAGSASCRECHADEYALWIKSNHGLAERLVRADLDQPAFVPSRTFHHGTQSTTVQFTNGDYFITSLGLSGRAERHQVERVIGNDPLRQFLVSAPGGRWQAVEASFDPLRNEWFNVFGDEDRQPGEWGHWTGRGMTWNSMCAACHNTRLQKNYDEATDSYHTAMSEPTVSCEACHGPLQAHVDWQKKYRNSGRADPTLPMRTPNQIVETCASCHSRRADLTGAFQPGDAFADHFDLTVVGHSDTFYPDGQIHDEDYEYTAFLGSKMHAHGVVCGDCHDPHSAKTRLPGNFLCLRCHDGSVPAAPKINPVTHSHHQVFGYDTDGLLTNANLASRQNIPAKQAGGECVNCHMPQTVYMQRHWRHDHGFTIPDPLLTKQFDIPNACNRCHTDKDANWSLAAVEKWYGPKMERPTRQRAEWLALARQGDASAREPLLALLDSETNSYWQAVVVGLLDQWVGDTNVDNALIKSLDQRDPLVRANAVRALEPLLDQPGSPVAEKIKQLLADPSRNVRIAAAWVLRSTLDTNSTTGRDLLHFLDINADQPVGQMQNGGFYFARGDLPAALEHYQKAVAWDPNSAPFRHDYAVVLSVANRNEKAIGQLEAACRLAPREAEYRYDLGLAWNAAGDLPKSVEALEAAVALDPRHDRAWYNLGLARNSAGQIEPALEALNRAESIAPDDARIPYARATILARAGKADEAKTAAQRALRLQPDFVEAMQLLQDLSPDK